ncbi:carboxypeptidase-like regulatory domain-containing protein [Myroides marinus]|uniref:CarboxypepD_reg-like domain-containing protein n=1 Tax=Myroides marinus TaxID=703342 RepID=A0A1H6TH45_9FLAO|nr:carboxypeptidase-like regulatory domain-containing protein [Myroides marinus]MDM1371857.1 carboxypeptidase-like regulatory domain-containing protein [Myroides marinus]MDM1390119.1 carboxypeptidase-like regulatory domain-containing protein [Myroides marinus]MDM1403767.1 carboxypeptidase-like regulatory domain-containing protein [Myroides marinus]MDM1533171.1 carboxypeptidase-like regulatory domain-containing protein [Myroides marinus]MDM1540133.1 carboxypeptidase-like regulatory domain-conta
MKYRIEIPEPCHEDWNLMTPQDKGRHCAVCDKVVVDFSKASKQEIINHIKKEGKICGRIPRQYIGLNLEEEKIRKSFGLNGMVATMVNLLALTTISTAVAQEKPKVESVCQDTKTSTPLATLVQSTTKNENTRVIKGKTYEGGLELPGVTIMIKGTDIGTQSNLAGEYELVVPEKYNTKRLTIVASFIGLSDVKVKVGKSKDNVDFHLETSGEVLGDIEIIRY